MTPVPLDLPLRPPEAAELANLVFSLAERKPLNEEVRNRIASRLAAFHFESLRPYPLSLERDPVHHSTYYMALDGQDGEPLLLHMAPAAAPTSAIFAKPLLIGRMRRAAGPEMVLNAVLFGPSNHEAVSRFAGQIDDSFLPRAQASRAAIVAPAVPASFEAFRSVWKSTRRNLAAVEMSAADADPAAFYFAAIWSAIRAGWREGYTAGISIPVATTDPHCARQTIAEAAPLTRFAIDVSALVTGSSDPAVKFAEAIKAAARAHELIRQARAARKLTRPFDFELSFEHTASPTSAEELSFCLASLRDCGHAAQLAAPQIDASSDLPALAAAAQSAQCVFTLKSATAIDRALASRLNLRLPAEASITETAAELFG
ncbi:MAG TPA: hypothetical protein VKB88_06150 [Bryobacteraceae bacterium]|nr:hypothetical protein [Bryobacteraceae bacterium]